MNYSAHSTGLFHASRTLIAFSSTLKHVTKIDYHNHNETGCKSKYVLTRRMKESNDDIPVKAMQNRGDKVLINILTKNKVHLL